MAARGMLGLYSLYIYIENFKKKKKKTFRTKNCRTNFNIIWQKCSFGDPVQELFKPLWFVKKHDAWGQGLYSLYIFIEKFKNLPVRNHWTDSNITWQKCFFGDPLSRLFKPSCFVKKYGRRGWGVGGGGGVGSLFSLYIYIEKFLKSYNEKPLNWYQYNLAEILLWWSSTKIVRAVVICQKTWLAGFIFPLYLPGI